MSVMCMREEKISLAVTVRRAFACCRNAVVRGGMVAGVLVGAASVQASPSGLNNTPTADTCPVQTLLLQTWEGFGYNMTPDNWVGMKYGLFKNAEIGGDWKMNGDPSRPPVFQAKYTIDVSDQLPKLGLGIANVSNDKDLNGDPMPYAVLSYDIKGLMRLHAGYGFQEDNEGAFGGVDRTFEVGALSLMPCFDIIQINDQHDALLAPGIKISAPGCKLEGLAGAILRNIAFETWVNLPSQGNSESYVAKLDYAIHF